MKFGCLAPLGLAFRVREGPATPNDKVEVREWTYERIGMGGGCTNSVRVC